MKKIDPLIFEKILKYISIRPRSEKEVRDYFKRKKFDLAIDPFMEELRRLKLLDDLEFAKWWVDQRTSFSPRPKKVIFKELVQKGVEKEIINEVIDNIQIDEVLIAKQLLRKISYKLEDLDNNKKRQKIYTYLSSRGFSWNVISDVLK